MSARFPSVARLKVRREFTAVQDGGRRVSTKFMTVLGQPNGRTHDRLGIIASRRLGGAVARNRAKRVLREIFRHHLASTPPGVSEPARVSAAQSKAAKSLDLVIIPRTDLLAAPVRVVEAEFASAVRKLRGAR